MTDRIREILDAVTARVFAFQPKDKGLAAKKTGERLKRENQDDRESSI